MRHVTLLTDFGTREGEHTVMKGVIWRIVPGNPVADLSHDISPQNIREGALVLERTAHFFPPETVHVVVIDPGVGTARKGIAAQFGDYFFVGPDNGVCTPLLERAEREGKPIRVVTLDNPKYWNPVVSSIFHGRDIFAPCGGHLAAGVPLEELGNSLVVEDLIRFHIPQPVIEAGKIEGEVMHIDSFGNLICNITRSQIEALGENKQVWVKGINIGKLEETFGAKLVGELVAVYSPTNYLMIAVTNGNAEIQLDISVGETVFVK